MSTRFPDSANSSMLLSCPLFQPMVRWAFFRTWRRNPPRHLTPTASSIFASLRTVSRRVQLVFARTGKKVSRLNSKFACEWSVSRLADPHLWTFTFPVVLIPRDAARRWSKLQRDLVRSVGMYGVRVFEPHPGGHGLHVHLVVSGRYEVDIVRPFALRHGFGRINVIRCSHPEYIAKYLTKSHRVEGWSWRGLRLWASIGKRAFSVPPTRARDVSHESPVRSLYDRLKRVLEGVSDYREARLLYMACEWYLAGLMKLGVLVDYTTRAHIGLVFTPIFPSRQLSRCVFVRRRVATPPAREEDGKRDAPPNLV